MLRSLWLAAPAVLLFLVTPAAPLAAQEPGFRDAMAAYRSGDYDTALRAFRNLAEQGHGEAQASLGDLYRKGRGVAQDHAEAARWYRRAADQGSAYAQTSLGLMYRDGLGIPRDPERAYMWFDLSFRNAPDHRADLRERAALYRDQVAESLSPQALDRARRMTVEWRPGAETVRTPPGPPPANSGTASDRIGLPAAIVLVVVTLTAAFFFLVRRRARRRRADPASGGPLASGSEARPLLPEVGSIVSGEASSPERRM